jgi:RimJ/RimL family protein N-acetyltransferase
MTSRLRPLTLADVEQVRIWREDPVTRSGLRRPDPLTPERQAQWYHDTICHPDTSSHRYWAVEVEQPGLNVFVGQVSLESIAPYRKAEIGLISDPAMRGKGYGRIALDLLLAKGFDEMGLQRIWGVCYTSNKALGFWDRTETNTWDGQEWPSRRFWFTAEKWRERRAA